jgi:class 3 adenylate cyclase/tetratricopeptide (TPR) repeat protein
MATCRACSHENRGSARFCDSCGAALALEAPGREERKVVTVLFADLVGFTSRAEQLDPEDVRALLSPYYARLRVELERFGGTVEKFIGDAVMALFGAPIAHEDDPERAVRAALAIRDWVVEEEAELQLRIAVNTGEALIALGARPSQGEGMASGDVVNTTARLQSAAPVNGILVGETTYRATRHVIDYRDAEPVEAKGKTEPVRVWEAMTARSRVGSEAVSVRAPLIGRSRELDQVVDAFERARQERSTQQVTLAGVPGIGKSRLVAELLAHVDSLEELIFWRHGRSLPYGEGAAFWALGEMVKAQAGILESDPPEDVSRKLGETVAQHVEQSERSWVEGKLGALVGLGGDKAVGGAREESFSAWRRFLESLAEERPLVLVFEDLHWAGDELLDFVDELPEWVEDAPMLVLCTARPELLDRRPGWGGGKRNATTISLSPLASDETAQLLASLLDRPLLPAETQAELLMRAGGNPLYAEQFARMLSEGGKVGDALPETVQGIIAARLDSLADGEKRLLQDAAVLGKVFWAGSLATVTGSESETVEQQLRSLGRKEFVRRERHSSVEGELEYAFNHVLVRDVAYGQIPRSERASKHRRAAEWIESLGRGDDQAELLAHHYLSALELVRASGGEVDDLVVRARTAVRAAGAQALALRAYTAAARSYELAAGLTGEPDPGRPRALLGHGLALKALNDERRFDLLEEAGSELLSVGDLDGAAEVEVALAEAWWHAGDRERCSACLERAADLVRGRQASVTSAEVLAQIARFRSLFGDELFAIELARQSLELAEAFGRDDVRATNLITLGTAGFYVRDPDLESSLADVRAGVDLALACGDLPQVSRGYSNLGSLLNLTGDLSGSEEAVLEASRITERIGNVPGMRFTAGNVIECEFYAGRWQSIEARANAFLEESEKEPHYMDGVAFCARSMIELAGDKIELARADVERAIAVGRRVVDPQAKNPALAMGAFVYAELGQYEQALPLLEEIEPEPFIGAIPMAFFAAAELGTAAEFRERVRAFGRETGWDRAGDAVLDGRWADAADAYDEIGARSWAALAALRATQTLVEQGRRAEADEQLIRALAFYRSVGATRYIREGESLLAASA